MDYNQRGSGSGMNPNNNNMQQQPGGMQPQGQGHPRISPMLGAAGMMGGVRDGGGGGTNDSSSSSQPRPTAAMTAPMIMNLLTNPALAAAAASAMFPPAAMLSNPGAFLAMPEAFAIGTLNPLQQHQQHQHQSAMGNNSGRSTSSQLGMMTMPQGMQLQNMMGPNNGTGSATRFDPSGVTSPGGNNSQASTQQTHSHIAPNMKSLAPYNMTGASAAIPNAQSTHPGMMPNFGASGNSVTATASASVASDDKDKKNRAGRADLTSEEKAKQNRDRNREHARSTRLRKKAYVQKLKELVECLHAERTEEVRQRRVAIQHLAEKQNVRRNVVRNFLRFHTTYETDARKWATLLEDDFWLKQPVTPYRSFRRAEIEQESRVARGVESMINDAASLSVMIECIGSRSQRWMQIKREEFALLESANRGTNKTMPRCIQREDSRLQHAISSLSSSSGAGSSNQSSSEESGRRLATSRASAKPDQSALGSAAKVSASSGSSNESRKNQNVSADEYHDYHAKPLADPKLNVDSEQDESPEESNASSNSDMKRISTDSSSGDDSAGAVAGPRAAKKRKVDHKTGSSQTDVDNNLSNTLPPNIATKGGIGHSIRAEELPAAVAAASGANRLSVAPAVALPPFAGIGKKRSSIPRAPAPPRVAEPGNGSSSSKTATNYHAAIISADANESSDCGEPAIPQILAQYHINEDDMILMEDILMCPFVFRSHNAVMCGALSECVVPGMLRAHFSTRNKLQSLELVYDAMGFMQQLERASGNEGTAQIIPGSLEMALTPSTTDALVITLAKPPFLIVNVNEVWTTTTGYTQMEVEGREYLALLEGEGTCSAASERPGKPRHKFDEVARGRCACSTNIHYDKEGRDYVEFVCSYPLTNAADEVTHLLHVSKELPSPQEASTSMGFYTSS